MGKYYQTDDICEVMNDVISKELEKVCDDETLTGEETAARIIDIRQWRKFATLVVATLIDMDKEYEERTAAWRAKEGESK